MELDEQVDLSSQRARDLRASHPTALGAHFDRPTGRIVIRLSSWLDLSFLPCDAQGLEDASAAELEEIEISPSGFGIHFPKLDVDIYLPALLEGFLGSKSWMAGRLGSTGGMSKSAAKTSAAQKNGRLGGRPKKISPTHLSL
jgi:hypothetical protein